MSDSNQPPADRPEEHRPEWFRPQDAAPSPQPAAPPPPPARRKSGWKKVLLIVLIVAGLGIIGLAVVGRGLAALTGLAGEETLTPVVYQAGEGDQVIAVLKMDGLIDGDKAAVMDRFRRIIEKDDHVKAILLRVDSPGGVVAPCDRIYHALKGLQAGKGPKRKGKKLVVSMGSMATSGGYYISSPADAIYAEPTTITGSIGVLSTLFTVKGTLEKIGVDVKVVRSTQAKDWKAAPNPFEQPTAPQMAELQRTIDAFHERFQGIVEAERGSKIKTTKVTVPGEGPDGKGRVDVSPYNGKVYLADDARKIGLIDGVGYFDDAIDATAKLANLDKPKVVIYRVRRSPLSQLGLFQAPPISPKVLDELQVPKLMMVWKVGG